MADPSRADGRDLVFCHECQNEWRRAEHGLVCPTCQSDFTEIIEQDNDPRQAHVDDVLYPDNSSPTHHLHNHDPWSQEAPDPGEGDIDEVIHGSGPNGSMRFTRITYRSSTPRRAGNPQVQPVPEVMSDFQRMVGDMMGTPMGQAYPPPRTRSAHPLAPFGPGPMMAGGFQEYPGGPQRMGGGFTFSTHRQLWPRDANGPQPVADPVTDIPGVFQMMMQGLADPHTRTVPGGFPDTQQAPPNPFAALFATLLNPGAAAHGDAVYTQEALDRVISQLMEQNAGSNAPGPAPEAAIASLPTKKVDLKMLGDEGKAECSVCMDEVPLGDEVTSLPCSHWFHTACATAWLNEHDTCPICRKGITPKDGNASTSRMPGQEARNAEPWRRPSASSSRRTSTGLFAGPRSPGVMPEDQAGSSTRPTPRRNPTSDRRRSHGGVGESGEGGGISGRLRGWFGGGGS